MADNTGSIAGGGVKYSIVVDLGGATPSTVAQMALSLASLQKAAAGDYSGLTKLATSFKQLMGSAGSASSLNQIDKVIDKLTEATKKLNVLAGTAGGQYNLGGSSGNVFRAHESAVLQSIGALGSQVTASVQAWANITSALRNASNQMQSHFHAAGFAGVGGSFTGTAQGSYRGYVGSPGQVSVYGGVSAGTASGMGPIAPYVGPPHTPPPPPPPVQQPPGGGVGGAFGGAAAGAAFLTNSLNTLNTAMVGLGSAIGASKIFDFVKEITLLAGRVQNLATVRNVIGGNAGYSEGQLIGIERQVTGLNITTQVARQAEAMLAKNQLPIEKAPQLARAAQDYAVLMGLNSSETLEHMVTAIVRREPRMLRTIGVNATPEQTYERFARQSGRQISSIAEEEKSRLLLNEILKQSVNVQGTYESAMKDAYKQYTSLARVVEEAQRALGDDFVPALEDAVKMISQLGSGVDAPGKRIGLTTGLGAAMGALGATGLVGGAAILGVAANPLITVPLVAAAALGVGSYAYSSAVEAERRKAIEDARLNAAKKGAAQVDLSQAMEEMRVANAGAGDKAVAKAKLVETAKRYGLKVDSTEDASTIMKKIESEVPETTKPLNEQLKLARGELAEMDPYGKTGQKYIRDMNAAMRIRARKNNVARTGGWSTLGGSSAVGQEEGEHGDEFVYTNEAEQQEYVRRRAKVRSIESTVAQNQWRNYLEKRLEQQGLYEQFSDLEKEMKGSEKRGLTESGRRLGLFSSAARRIADNRLDPRSINAAATVRIKEMQEQEWSAAKDRYEAAEKEGASEQTLEGIEKEYRKIVRNKAAAMRAEAQSDIVDLGGAAKTAQFGRTLAWKETEEAGKRAYEDQYTAYRTSIGDSEEMLRGQFRYAEERDKFMPEYNQAAEDVNYLAQAIDNLRRAGKSTIETEQNLASARQLLAVKTEELAAKDLKYAQSQTKMAFAEYERHTATADRLSEEIASLTGQPGKAMTGEAIMARRRKMVEEYEGTGEFLQARRGARMERFAPGSSKVSALLKDYQKEMRSARGHQLSDLQNEFSAEMGELAQDGNPTVLRYAQQAAQKLAMAAFSRLKELNDEQNRAAEEQRILDETINKKRVQLSIEQQQQAVSAQTLSQAEQHLAVQEEITANIMRQNGRWAEADMLVQAGANARQQRMAAMSVSQSTAAMQAGGFMPGTAQAGAVAVGINRGMAAAGGGAGGGPRVPFVPLGPGAMGGNNNWFNVHKRWTNPMSGREEFAWQWMARNDMIMGAQRGLRDYNMLMDEDGGPNRQRRVRQARQADRRADFKAEGRKRKLVREDEAWIRRQAFEAGMSPEEFQFMWENPGNFGAGPDLLGVGVNEAQLQQLQNGAGQVVQANGQMRDAMGRVVGVVGVMQGQAVATADAFNKDADRAERLIA